jgi:heat shock protein HslJ
MDRSCDILFDRKCRQEEMATMKAFTCIGLLWLSMLSASSAQAEKFNQLGWYDGLFLHEKTQIPDKTIEGQSDASAASRSLENTTWVMTYFGDVPVPKTGWILYKPDLILTSGRMSGSGGCNRVAGDYKLSGDQLTFGETMVITAIHCPSRLTEMENTFLEALPRVKHWKIEGQQLILLDTEAKQLARFEATPKLSSEL